MGRRNPIDKLTGFYQENIYIYPFSWSTYAHRLKIAPCLSANQLRGLYRCSFLGQLQQALKKQHWRGNGNSTVNQDSDPRLDLL